MKRYKLNKECTLIIQDDVVDKLKFHSQETGMNESGGILLGKVKEDYSKIIITDISVPSELDESGRFYFIRNKSMAQKFLELKWNESKYIINYIGEWHTHAETLPKPSSVDLRMIDQCFNENYLPFNLLFLIIVGCTGELYVGYKTDFGKELHMLREI